MKARQLFFGMAFLLIVSSCKNEQASSAAKFRGMWKLDKFEMYDSLAGNWKPDPAWAGYNGYILYDGLGHMAVHLTPPGYRDFNASRDIDSMNNDDLKKMVHFYSDNFVYVSNYQINDSIIRHNRLSATNPKQWGTTLTRDFEFRRDTLLLKPHEKIGNAKVRLRWVRL